VGVGYPITHLPATFRSGNSSATAMFESMSGGWRSLARDMGMFVGDQRILARVMGMFVGDQRILAGVLEMMLGD